MARVLLNIAKQDKKKERPEGMERKMTTRFATNDPPKIAIYTNFSVVKKFVAFRPNDKTRQGIEINP